MNYRMVEPNSNLDFMLADRMEQLQQEVQLEGAIPADMLAQFDECIAKSPAERKREDIDFLVAICNRMTQRFRMLPHDVMSELMRFAAADRVPTGAFLLEQGAIASSTYLVLEGALAQVERGGVRGGSTAARAMFERAEMDRSSNRSFRKSLVGGGVAVESNARPALPSADGGVPRRRKSSSISVSPDHKRRPSIHSGVERPSTPSKPRVSSKERRVSVAEHKNTEHVTARASDHEDAGDNDSILADDDPPAGDHATVLRTQPSLSDAIEARMNEEVVTRLHLPGAMLSGAGAGGDDDMGDATDHVVAASQVALTEVRVLRIDLELLDRLMTEHQQFDLERKMRAVASVPMMGGLPESAIRGIAESARTLRFGPRAVICRQGDPTECVYIMLSGEASVVRRMAVSEVKRGMAPGGGAHLRQEDLLDIAPELYPFYEDIVKARRHKKYGDTTQKRAKNRWKAGNEGVVNVREMRKQKTLLFDDTRSIMSTLKKMPNAQFPMAHKSTITIAPTMHSGEPSEEPSMQELSLEPPPEQGGSPPGSDTPQGGRLTAEAEPSASDVRFADESEQKPATNAGPSFVRAGRSVRSTVSRLDSVAKVTERMLREKAEREMGDVYLELAQVGPGACFGEQGVLQQSTRSASIICNSAAEVMQISRLDLLTRVPDSVKAALHNVAQSFKNKDDGVLLRHLDAMRCWSDFRRSCIKDVMDDMKRKRDAKLPVYFRR
ncbi:unnamed protein product [Pedinophyceae sp. YPF-701]|nr:unnamed protein product [Pedinophyceae sp. YPF-701]